MPDLGLSDTGIMPITLAADHASQALVAAIAIRRGLGGAALAEMHAAVAGQFEFKGLQARALVRAIAPRLMC